jgi:hypothetical protein
MILDLSNTSDILPSYKAEVVTDRERITKAKAIINALIDDETTLDYDPVTILIRILNVLEGHN